MHHSINLIIFFICTRNASKYGEIDAYKTAPTSSLDKVEGPLSPPNSRSYIQQFKKLELKNKYCDCRRANILKLDFSILNDKQFNIPEVI